MIIVEVKDITHVVLLKFQKMIHGGTPKPVLSFSALWYLAANAACRMKDQGISHPIHDKKAFARQFFAALGSLCDEGTCWKREEENGNARDAITQCRAACPFPTLAPRDRFMPDRDRPAGGAAPG